MSDTVGKIHGTSVLVTESEMRRAEMTHPDFMRRARALDEDLVQIGFPGRAGFDVAAAFGSTFVQLRLGGASISTIIEVMGRMEKFYAESFPDKWPKDGGGM